MGTVEDFRKAIESDPAMLLRDSAKFEMAVRFGTVHVDSAPVVFWYETYRAARRHE
jgi:hypothetical protein